MDRSDCAIVVNTCPKYFYILDAHFGLLRRYGEACKWPVYLATEQPDDFAIQMIAKKYNVTILPLANEQSDFLESRVAAMEALPSHIQYVLPLQEDFLLERPGIDVTALQEALSLFDSNHLIQSIRLMPCPGSSARNCLFGSWKQLEINDMLFSYQATLWRRSTYRDYLFRLIHQCREEYPHLKPMTPEWNQFAVRNNPAETHLGLSLLDTMFPQAIHLCWSRKASWANAVYWSPWPYRPTAIVKGVLEPWAAELIRREGFVATNPPKDFHSN
jgi:hypothetical protein